MDTVLLVDDERPFLESLKDGLSSYSSNLNVVCAANGREALAILEASPVDVVLTDLKMPIMDGFELLAYMSTHYPNIPVIVMTAFGTPETTTWLEKMGALQLLEKPLDIQSVASKILENLASNSMGYLHGITLPAMMELVASEKKNFNLKLKAGDLTGNFFFQEGVLVDASCGELRGKPAVSEIMSWNLTEIKIEKEMETPKHKDGVPIETQSEVSSNVGGQNSGTQEDPVGR